MSFLSAPKTSHLLPWTALTSGARDERSVEFAKLETATTQHSMRTGTFPFMAVEVEGGRYLYRKISTATTKERLKALLDARAVERAKKRLAKQGATPSTSGSSATAHPSKSAAQPETNKTSFVTQPFIHNPLHDPESVFWVSLWEVVCSEFVKDDPTMTQEQWDGYIVAHGEFAADLFGDSKFRSDIMRISSDDFLAYANNFIPRVREIMAILDHFRTLLITRYQQVEEGLGTPDYKIEFSIAAKGLHEDTIEKFEEISSMLTATSDLRVVIKEEDTLPVKLVKKKIRKNAVNGTADTIVTATDAGGETSSRPAKSLKTPRNRFAALGSAPAFLPDIKRRTRSQTGSLPTRVNGGTSGSGRR
ncbi:hypothetical protein PHLGIDRAFT_37416 [Phlebiopsis gigantea 11061_1 CR5-6]|uniref:Uncharacterized protein n=1 Tax=Phlebiopsis gigantea (strain 11061_1 CR5-6) TaxID=745531 RepID=A0A0C3S5D7_PHLG1|nr:hypothetical protein PHLGIDRAFT_37416 [Phlebiopsis gigantea 11061_1 CR5-6]